MWFPDQQHWLHHQGTSEKRRGLHRDTESETVGRGQLSVILVTTRSVHSLFALDASFNPPSLVVINMYQIVPPLQMRMTETKESFLKDSIMQL